MDEPTAALLGAIVGALAAAGAASVGAFAAVGAAWIRTLREQKAEHRKWLREQRRQAYANALRSLAGATVVPVGSNVDEIAAWYHKLAEVREWLVVLQVYCTRDQNQLAKSSRELFDTINDIPFVCVATEAAAIKAEYGDVVFVSMKVGVIRREVKEVLDLVTQIAHSDLVRDTKV